MTGPYTPGLKALHPPPTDLFVLLTFMMPWGHGWLYWKALNTTQELIYWFVLLFFSPFFPSVSGWHLSEGSVIDPHSSGGPLVTGQCWYSSSSHHLFWLAADPQQALPKGRYGQQRQALTSFDHFQNFSLLYTVCVMLAQIFVVLMVHLPRVVSF